MFHEIVCINQFDSFNKLHVIQGIVSQIKLKIQQNTVTTNMLIMNSTRSIFSLNIKKFI